MHTRDGHDTRHGADWFRDVTVRGTRREREGMARHCSWRAGGAADRWFEPADLDDLIVFMHALPAAEPLLWLGLGSNLLVRDGGLRGTVISTGGGLAGLQWHAARTLHAGCGAPCAKVAKRVAAAGLGGGEFLAGIPGTIGGALAMNAGAFGGETWQHVVEVETVNRRGEVARRSPEDYRVAYREVRGPAGEWFLAARFRFDPSRPTSLDAVRALIQERQAKQPLGMPSCGSVFRNPPGDFAGRLIEAAGLKGARIGGAQVSEKHANFIINTGKATAADIEALIGHVQARVAEVHGISLVPEVHVLGEAAGRESRG